MVLQAASSFEPEALGGRCGTFYLPAVSWATLDFGPIAAKSNDGVPLSKTNPQVRSKIELVAGVQKSDFALHGCNPLWGLDVPIPPGPS